MAVAAELAVDGNSTSFVLAWERGGFRVLQEAGSRSSGPSPASPLADGGMRMVRIRWDVDSWSTGY